MNCVPISRSGYGCYDNFSRLKPAGTPAPTTPAAHNSRGSPAPRLAPNMPGGCTANCPRNVTTNPPSSHRPSDKRTGRAVALMSVSVAMIACGILRTLGIIGCAALLSASCGLSRHSSANGISRPRICATTTQRRNSGRWPPSRIRALHPAGMSRTITKTLALERGQGLSTAQHRKPAYRQTVIVQFALQRQLNSAGRFSLDEAALICSAHFRVTIIGRTDSKGEMAFNEQSARHAPTRFAITCARSTRMLTARIAVQAQGACCFIASNDTATGRAKNRRAEVVFQDERGRPHITSRGSIAAHSPFTH